MSEDDFYDELISNKTDTNKMLDNLYKPVRKNKGVNQTHFYTISKPNIVQFADLLFLPNDNDYKYALVVTDMHKRITDSRPLKTKTAPEIIQAFKDIWKGKYLREPKRIIVDAGNEFKGDVGKYFSQNKINVKTAMPGRHQQMGIVEQKNKVIGKALLKRQTAQELITGAPSTEWTDDLPKVIAAINRAAKPIKEKNIGDAPVCSGESCILLDIGDSVRVALDEPRAATEDEKKLHGKFRASDLRWEIKPRKITNIILLPGMPPLYQVEGRPSVSYTRNQIQPVNPKEKLPSPDKFIRKPKYFKVEKILDKKEENGKVYYLIKWFGYPDSDNSWEPEDVLKEDVPKLLKEFNEWLKPKKQPKPLPKKPLPKASPKKQSKTRIIKKPKKYDE